VTFLLKCHRSRAVRNTRWKVSASETLASRLAESVNAGFDRTADYAATAAVVAVGRCDNTNTVARDSWVNARRIANAYPVGAVRPASASVAASAAVAVV
jgi:hypothetical protein